MWNVVFAKQAAKGAKRLKSAGLDKKAKALVEAVREYPFKTPPSYEGLVGSLSGLRPRRISLRHRLVYEVTEDPFEDAGVTYEGTVKRVRMRTRYERL